MISFIVVLVFARIQVFVEVAVLVGNISRFAEVAVLVGNISRFAEVAQLVEHRFRKAGVVGSSPTFGSVDKHLNFDRLWNIIHLRPVMDGHR